MIRLLDLKTKSFGLDISQTSLKIVQLEKKSKSIKLSSFGELRFDKGIIEDGEIKKEHILTEEIKGFLKEMKEKKLANKNVIVSLPEKKSFLQIIKMPKMDVEELRSAIYFEAENYIPFPIERTYLDFQIVENDPKLNHLSILIAVSPKKIVDSYFFCLTKAGLNIQAMEIESQSIVRSVVKNEFSSDPVLIIDFGKNSTSLIVFNKNFIRLTSSCSLSSGDLDEAISNRLKISGKEAEDLKIKYGIKKTKNKQGSHVIEIITPLLEDLIFQIKKYINYYESHNKTEKIKKIILCGRGSNLKGLTEFFSQEFKVSATIASPWINILPEPLNEVPELHLEESIGYATALGLALRGINND